MFTLQNFFLLFLQIDRLLMVFGVFSECDYVLIKRPARCWQMLLSGNAFVGILFVPQCDSTFDTSLFYRAFPASGICSPVPSGKKDRTRIGNVPLLTFVLAHYKGHNVLQRCTNVVGSC